MSSNNSKNVCVVVLGDFGRSPRMQYHALSLAEMGHKVDVIAYGETEPMEEVKTAPLLYYHYLVPCPSIPIKIVNYAFKTVWQALNLLFLLIIARRPDVLIVQNPPAVPALFVCWMFCRILGCKLVIDWHNYGHSILALSLSGNNILVQITRMVEVFIGKRADHNFCVTQAMKHDLSTKWNIIASTLYDKPPLRFRPITLKEKHEFLLDFGKTYKELLCEDGSTIFTSLVNGNVELKPFRPGMLVSSTSWTEDEDFSILLAALQDYEDHIINGNHSSLPNLMCFITGKGHLKEMYCNLIKERNWRHVTVITPWLEPHQYPLMLASADLGVSLHMSSSGLDLPMKVVDMFGCGLPVCAYYFKCLYELVQHEKNGYIFMSSDELATQIQNWFTKFPNNEEQMEVEKKFKTALEAFQECRWRENWNNIAAPVFK
nr:unnamed protein product [Callosobruchus analis]